jgi:hypothetical protein
MANTPIMTPKQEQFMALDGLVQWTSGVITQAERLESAKPPTEDQTPEARRLAIAASRTEADLFVTAAWKLLQFRKWVKALGLCSTIDFSEIDKFDTSDTRDLRNMREHVVDYFRGEDGPRLRLSPRLPIRRGVPTGADAIFRISKNPKIKSLSDFCIFLRQKHREDNSKIVSFV